jgi:hypothetical protein
MSIVTDNSCVIAGDVNRCPADASITYAGDKKLLDASLSCPLDSVAQSDFMAGTQKGLCTCAVDIYDADSSIQPPVQVLGQTPDGTGGGETNVCDCYLCPTGMNLGVAFICENEIVGPCKSFNCFGDCNGDASINLISGITSSPTGAPTEVDGAAHLMASPTVWLVGFMIARMLRH